LFFFYPYLKSTATQTVKNLRTRLGRYWKRSERGLCQEVGFLLSDRWFFER